MPGRDNTGPQGQGPASGRGFGNCTSTPGRRQSRRPQNRRSGNIQGRGMGQAMGQGLGIGRRRRIRGNY